jgi:hypothetical protein
MAPSDYLARPANKTGQCLSTKTPEVRFAVSFCWRIACHRELRGRERKRFLICLYGHASTAGRFVGAATWRRRFHRQYGTCGTAVPQQWSGLWAPGTVVGDFWQRTQVTGDWGGPRTDLARQGPFFDLYTTSTYQGVTSGGIKANDSFVQNTQLSVNIDTARAGLWQGGLIHVTVQSRYGDLPNETFTARTLFL